MRLFFRGSFVVFCAGAVLAAALFMSSSGDQAMADRPVYFVTIDRSELDHVNEKIKESGFGVPYEIIESKGGIAVISLDELGTQELSGRMHDHFHKCAGFIRHETLDEARRSIEMSLTASTDLQLVDYTINNQAAVIPMIGAAAEPNIRQTIIDLSSLHTRRHDQQGGIDGANMILNKWRQLAAGRTDISVQPYAHLSPNNPDVFLTPQPTIIMTITGTEFPEEIVVLGGHQDSIRSGQATGAAPGSDDDASGIASLTEVIRVMMETDFRPKRTIQFMAYGAEEVGLVGSNNIAQNYRNQNKNVIGVIQLDMTNYGGDWADIVLITDNTNAAQNQFLRDLAAEYLPELVLKNDQCGYGCSDHKSWHDRQYPASMPFEAKFTGTSLDGIPAQYNTQLHTANDTLARSNNNADHALKFTRLAITFAAELAKGSIQASAPPRTAFDFDGDGRADISIYRPSAGEWWYLQSSDAQDRAFQFGTETDTIVPADFTGDGRADLAFYRPSEGMWYVLRSEDLTFYAFPFGSESDVPVPADYDGDGRADPAVFRPSTGTWYVLRSSDGEVSFTLFGGPDDRPVPADYDGDGRTDIAIYRPLGGSGTGEWWYLRSSDGDNRAFSFGTESDKPVPGDYTGDGRADIAFFRPSNGNWYVLRSEDNSFYAFPFGTGTDLVVPGDYDGDGIADPAVFRPSTGTWFVNRSTEGILITNFGTTTDLPLPSA